MYDSAHFNVAGSGTFFFFFFLGITAPPLRSIQTYPVTRYHDFNGENRLPLGTVIYMETGHLAQWYI